MAKEQSVYRWDATDYAQHSAAQFTWAQELIDHLSLQGHEVLLDIGCGDGRVSAKIADRVPHGQVIGIDSSREMITRAQATFPPTRHPNLRFDVMDAMHLIYDDAFDIVFSNAALHWVRDHRAVLLGVARSLRSGGRLLFQMGGKGNADAIIGVLNEVMHRPAWGSFFRDFAFPYTFYGPDDYLCLLAEADLQACRVELITRDMQQAGEGGLAGWLRTTWLPYTARVPPERRTTFIADVASAYVAVHPTSAQGTVHVKMVRLEVEAVKLRGRSSVVGRS